MAEKKNAEGAERNGENVEEQQQEEVGEEEDEGGDTELEREREPLSKEDIAYINELLKTKHTFCDGSKSQIFSYGPPKLGSASRSIVCHLCRVSCLDTPDAIKTHLNGKRHIQHLRRKSLTAKRIQEPHLLLYSDDRDNQMKQFKIFPGEDIPKVTPEFEDRIVEKAEWHFKKIDDEKLLQYLSQDPIYEYNKDKPIIGLDYILKMMRKNQIQNYCVLCEVLTQNAYQHLTDSQHQLTYIIKHFPQLYEKVVKSLKVNGNRAKEKCIRNIFRKLYRKIENKHGFKLMLPVDTADFFSSRSSYVKKVLRSPHYGEDTLQFTEKEVDYLINKSNNNISFIEPDPLKRPRKRRSAQQPQAPASKNARLDADDSARLYADDNARLDADDNARLDADEVSRWKKYVVVKEGHIKRIEAQYKRYEKDPQLHPSYQKEWSQFWQPRCSESGKANITPDTYNFEREWRAYWEMRLPKLFNIEIAECKNKERENFNLPIDRRTPSPYRRRATSYKPMGVIFVPKADLRNSNNFVPSLNNQQNFVGGPGQGGDRDHERTGDINAQQQQPSRKRPAPSRSREPVSVISVLRLLTALEDKLGSLGPKSVELLGKAALCEKNNNAKQLLMDHEYYVFFITATEKLKGQIMANVIDESKLHVVETAIEDLNRIVNLMDKENSNQGGGVGGGGATPGNRDQNANARGGNCEGESFGRNAGGNKYSDNFRSDAGQNNAGGNFRNDGHRGKGGNFRNDNGDFAGNTANYRSNTGSFRDINDGGNYRSGNNDASNRKTSNFDHSSYGGGNDDSNFGNGGGNYRSNNDDMRTFRRGNFNNDSGSYSQGTGGSNFSNSNSSNFANYRDGKDLTGGNYGSVGSSFDGGNRNTSGGMGFASNTSQYRSGGNYSNDNYNVDSSNFGYGVAGRNSSSAQSGSWMGGSGNVYSNKSNANTPAYSSGLGGFNSQQQTNSFTASYSTRNNPPTTAFNMSSGGGSVSNYRRYN